MTVATLTSAAQTAANALVASSDTAISEAVAAVNRVGYTALSYTPVTLPTSPTMPDELALPTVDDVDLDLPTEPDNELLFQDISPIEIGAAPLLTAVAPTLSLPTEPAALAAFNAALPVIDTNLAFPEPPDELMNPLLAAPVLTERDEPVKPQVALPSFTAEAPDTIPDAPTGLQATFETTYAGQAPSTIAMLDGYVDAQIAKFNPRYHEQMAAIETQLENLIDGGTGNPTEEAALYERSRSKTDAEGRRVRDAALSEWAALGHTLPGGAVAAALQRARQGTADNNAQAAREIVIKQIDVARNNLQFAVTTSLNLRQTMLSAALSYHQNLIQINGQAIEYAKTIVGLIIEAYNTAVKAYTVRLDGYKAEAAVYETRLKAALAGIELYRLEIAALEAMTTVDRNKVAVYQARIAALESLSGVYKHQIDAVLGRASLEKMKIDVFGAQTQARIAEVQAKNSEWLGYKASIDGQQAIAALHGEEVKTFGIRMDGWGREITAKAEVARAQALANQAQSENFRAVWAAYTAVVNARGDVARTRLENNRQEVIAFQAQSQAQVARAQIYDSYYRSTGDIAIKNASLAIDAIFKSAELQRAFGNSIASLATANAQVHGSVASAALSGMNTLAAETLTE